MVSSLSGPQRPSSDTGPVGSELADGSMAMLDVETVAETCPEVVGRKEELTPADETEPKDEL